MATAAATKPVARSRPPFRADQVGSLLRPQKLKDARERLLGPQTADQNLGPHNDAELRAVEDACIRDVIAMQERVGLRAVTDGEFRRRSWWLELVMNWGLSADRSGTTEMTWRNQGGAEQAFSRLWINAPIRWRDSPIVRAFAFLKANTRRVPKVTIPAPIVLHMFAGGDKGVRQGHYKDLDQFWDDVVQAYRHEIAALAAAGATYIQLDDTSIAFLCDPAYRAIVDDWGNDPDDLLVEYAERINQAASMPRQPRRILGGGGRLRPGRRRAVQQSERAWLFPRIRHRACWLVCAAAPAAQGQDRGARARVEQESPAGKRRRAAPADRRSGQIRAARPAGAEPAMRLRQLDQRQSADASRPGTKARAHRRSGDKRVGRCMTRRAEGRRA